MTHTEAARIYNAIFKRPVPPVLQQRFDAASQRLESIAPAELQAYRYALSAVADLEALELAARYTHRLPLLTRKFRLMVYLAETLPENQRLFVNEKTSFIAGLIQIALYSLRTVILGLKGLWLMRRVSRD